MYCGHRHHNILGQLVAAYGMAGERREKGLREVQGFLTSTGRFVGRREGLALAIAAGQVVERKAVELYSEDLY